MLTALRDAKRNGAKIIHINPLPETGLISFKHPQDYMKLSFGNDTLADLFLQVRVGSDAALMHGLMKVVLENKALDEDFISNKTEGFEKVKLNVSQTKWSQIEQDAESHVLRLKKQDEYVRLQKPLSHAGPRPNTTQKWRCGYSRG